MYRVIKATEQVYGMANLYPKRTGLPVIIWVDNVGAFRTNKHNMPRVKVQNVKGDKAIDDTFSLSIELEPKVLAGECKLSSKDLKAVTEYISDNYEVLMKAWNQEIDEDELKDILYHKNQ